MSCSKLTTECKTSSLEESHLSLENELFLFPAKHCAVPFFQKLGGIFQRKGSTKYSMVQKCCTMGQLNYISNMLLQTGQCKLAVLSLLPIVFWFSRAESRDVKNKADVREAKTEQPTYILMAASLIS